MPDVANRALNDARSLGSSDDTMAIRAGLLGPDGLFARLDNAKSAQKKYRIIG